MAVQPSPFSEDELIDFVRGSATPELSERIGDAMALNPALQAEIALMRGLKPALARSEGINPPGEFGWRKLEAEIKREKVPGQPNAAVSRPSNWKAAAAIFGIAALGQAVFIASAQRDSVEVGYQTASNPSADHVLAIAFTAEAKAAEISALLRKVDGSLIGGPSGLGLYRVGFPSDEALITGQTQFESSDLIELLAEE